MSAINAPEALEAALYAYACAKPEGIRAARGEVHTIAKACGWIVDLRRWVGNEVEATAPNGTVVWIEV